MKTETRHSNKLSDREIVRLHTLASEGTQYPQLARMFGCHVNTIIDHLAMRVCYSLAVYKAIGKPTPIPSVEPINIYDAAIFLPGWPSRDKVYRLYKAGVLSAWIIRKNLVTDFASVRKAARAMLPDGIWISNRSIESFLRLDDIKKLAKSQTKLKYWPSTEISFYPMPRVVQVAAESESELSIPAAIIHRCLQVERITGVATL